MIKPWPRNYPKSWTVERIVLEAKLAGAQAALAAHKRKEKKQ